MSHYPLYKLALKVAIKAHKGQKRRDGRPYITHPVRVAMNFEEDLHRAVAVMHDILEDCEEGESLICEGSLSHLLGDLRCLTRDGGEDYMSYIRRVSKCNSFVRAIKIADIMDNMTDHPTQNQIEKYSLALEILL